MLINHEVAIINKLFIYLLVELTSYEVLFSHVKQNGTVHQLTEAIDVVRCEIQARVAALEGELKIYHIVAFKPIVFLSKMFKKKGM